MVVIYISATNRGSTRAVADFYATPEKVIHTFLNNYNLKDGNILEPTAGNGNIIKVIRERESKPHYITSIEIRKEEYNNLSKYSNEVIITDFLNWQPTNTYKTIISNPPYSIAQEIIEKCFKIANEDTEIIMLLRTAFLESKKRYSFWQKYPLNGLYVLSQRPSFTGKGTDATSYSWFIWNGSDKQEIKVI
ncbi:MAG TPA: hypothetical protein GX708_15470 [Gallicola sp.]|nr:hypothetical protein [Gallicola sp.]